MFIVLLREILPIEIVWMYLIYIYAKAFKKRKGFKKQKEVILTESIPVEIISTVCCEFLT